TVSDGKQALERMKTLHPDIVLAGTVLPQVTGYDLVMHMRTIPGLRNVPVLLLTGAFETVDEEKLKASGANGILEKPVEPNNVIARVKELLGLKSEAKPAVTGRVVTSTDGPAENHLAVAEPPRAVVSTLGTPSKWQQLRDDAGGEADTHPVEDASTGSGDYLDTLGAAFDTLDQQLSGRTATEKPSRNPSGPLGQSAGAPDPRSPGRRPEAWASTPAGGNPVFEVDEEWFAGHESQPRADARAGRREIEDDPNDAGFRAQRPASAAPGAVFEVDDDWFAEADKARAAKLDEHRGLAADMGIHEVNVRHAAPVPNAPAPLSDPDFGLDDLKNLQTAAPAPADVSTAPQAPIVSVAKIQVPGVGSESSGPSREVADEFAQFLALERGDHDGAPMPAVQLIAPEVTDEMLGQVVARVAERLSTGAFGNQLMNAVAATVRDTVREITSATSERLVREIASEASERLSREIALETSQRLSREIATEASERLAREIASETSERLVREIASETSARLARDIVSETSERLVRDEIERIKSRARS
ncbi:MAG: response regulator, partial [Vicinamibacterales bacterium]